MEFHLATEQPIDIACSPAFPTHFHHCTVDWTFLRRCAKQASANLAHASIMPHDYFEFEDVAALNALLRDAMMEPGEVRTRELHVIARSGEWRTFVADAAAFPDGSRSAASGMVISVRDVTQERQAEQRLFSSQRLVAMSQTIDSFIHELNNVLQALIGTCELLRGTQPPEPLRLHLQVIETQTHRARELVQNVIVFANPPNEVRAVVDLNELIKRALRLRRYSLNFHHISVRICGDDSYPVMGNPAELMQVFLNILVNAEQACTTGARTGGNIRISLEQSGDTVCCAFQDDGPGISPEFAHGVFEPFFTTKEPVHRAGLGLSICRSIIEAHEGSVEALSAPGGGAIFRVLLPALARQRTQT